jgi:hypothetical protein
MKTIMLITNSEGETGYRLLNSVKSAVPVTSDTVFESVNDFCDGFKRLRGRVDVAVLLAESQQQLLEILSLHDLLENVRIILVLPDRVHNTTSKGLLLRPRFMEYVDGNFEDIAAVLNKMKEHTMWNM